MERNRLNEVRPRRPEQSLTSFVDSWNVTVSMKSGLEGRNNGEESASVYNTLAVSMKSGLEGRNNHSRPLPER